jgi:hypothetical protein
LSLGGSLGARHDHTHPVTQPIAAVDDHSITQRAQPELTAGMGPSVGPS